MMSITRVELHHATERDYENLRTFMARRFFAHRVPVGTAQEIQELPPGEYFSETYLTGEAAAKAAKAAANATGRNSTILSTVGDVYVLDLRVVTRARR